MKVKVIYSPPRRQNVNEPKPPPWWETFWRRTGTVVDYRGVRWVLVIAGAADQMWRQWARACCAPPPRTGACLDCPAYNPET